MKIGNHWQVNDTASVGLRIEQLSILRNMVKNHKTGTYERMTSKHYKIPWIFNTGPSNHMTANLKCMMDLLEMVECRVGLPDGIHTIATKEGSVNHSENFKF